MSIWQEHWWTILTCILILPIIGIIAFGGWLHWRKDIDLENSTRCWDTFVKLISAITVIVSGAMLLGKYIDQQSQLEVAKVQQANREIALRQVEYYRQILIFDEEQHNRRQKLLTEAKVVAARIASMIASESEPDQASLTRFEELYHADLIGIEKEGGDVELAMFRFREKLNGTAEAPRKTFTGIALELSTAVQTEIEESKNKILEQHQQITDLLTRTIEIQGTQ